MNKLRRVNRDYKFPVFSVRGEHVMRAWESLKKAHEAESWPLVVGSPEDFDYLKDAPYDETVASPSAVLDVANELSFPNGFREYKIAETEELLAKVRGDASSTLFADELGISEFEYPKLEDLNDDWPQAPIPGDEITELTVAEDWQTGKPLEEVLIVMVPTADWTEVPAHLNYGGWNDCPMPEWHVAAFKHWKNAYDCELVGLSHDTLNIRVGRRPSTRTEALELALDQYYYCGDIVDQGVGDVRNLAKILMESDWWFFWWD